MPLGNFQTGILWSNLPTVPMQLVCVTLSACMSAKSLDMTTFLLLYVYPSG